MHIFSLDYFLIKHTSVYSRALTEKIVAVLPRMKCPHRLEPHQIQGLDFISIFPVIQVTTPLLNHSQTRIFALFTAVCYFQWILKLYLHYTAGFFLSYVQCQVEERILV